MKIALIFDPITQSGGAEKLLWCLADQYPDSQIYTAIYNPEVVPERFKSKIISSWLQKFPRSAQNPKPYLPLLPLAYESFDLTSYDRIISITTLFAKAVITKPEAIHIGYINSPPRFLYSQQNLKRYINNNLLQNIMSPVFKWLKFYDVLATNRPDILLANSQNIQQKIKTIYRLSSQVVYPFAGDFYFKKRMVSKNPNQFVIVSRLEKWKRIDYAIQAFNKLPEKKLIIVGVGDDMSRLKKIAKNNIIFTGWVDDSKVADIVSRSQAMIMPQDEDFGITSVESQALCTPVIGLNSGGVKETVINGITGILYEKQTSKSLINAVKVFEKASFKADKLYQNALKYRQSQFIQNIAKYL